MVPNVILVVALLSLLCLVPLRYSMSAKQFWSILEAVPLLGALVLGGITLSIPAFHTKDGKWVRVNLYTVYCFIHAMTGVGILVLLSSSASPATELALVDIALVTMIVQTVSELVEQTSIDAVLKRMLSGELNLQIVHPQRIKVRIYETLVILAICELVYCRDARHDLRSPDSILPWGNPLGYLTCARMVLTVTIPLVQVYPLFKKSLSGPWCWCLMTLLITLSSFILYGGTSLIIIAHLILAQIPARHSE